EYKGEPDELVSARIVSSEDHLLLISRKGMSIRFAADDDSIRPLGRVTGGGTGMKFKDDEELLSMEVVQPGTEVFVVTEGGYAKRTPVDEYRVQGRGGLGIRVAKITEQRGDLVGGLIVDEGEEVLVVMERGKVVRSNIDEVPAKGRNTMGVVFAKPGKNDRIIAVTRGPETAVEDEDEAEAVEAEVVAPEAETPEAVETETGSEDVEE
ncbi:DNA gyrase C-terminal beta-propeller domain-containing protein, partial [Burkholderia multivorans]|uniref:DNA gyrase C-terminal beta-propeller domain-containing protein n=1 Tax=Burkholderia multivorans TaxID=87883 RepID=UPI000DBBC2AE